MLYGLWALGWIAISTFLLAKRAAISVWAITYAGIFLLALQYAAWSVWAQICGWVFLGVLFLGVCKPLRRQCLTRFMFKRARSAIPAMSATEREALEAGTVSWEGEIFSGDPDFNRLLETPDVALTEEERVFLEGPTHELCSMLDNWDITHNLTDLPEEVWTFIKNKGFLGMIIPKQYGGLEFSATAQMSILAKLYSCSVSAATTVSVPNSLGPAELLLKYGTKAQKNYYLPRLANGNEIPCFALTGPYAGSDAASIPDRGIVCREMVDGQAVLGMRLTWDKRYITLCPVATIIGLAFRLFDPDNLLGLGYDIGISCALIPAETPGVVKGRRHFPLNTAFLNGPTQGNDVFVPIDCLIGGVAMAGQGWRMLMECLSAGRAISLPSSALGGVQAAALGSGAYARIRKQFHQPIAKFEGIQEPLARIAANAYMVDAALSMTAAAIDHGAKPSVAGAILKYHTTERARRVAMDAMDIHGGKGICLGPNNYLGRGYQEAPISITVEGANILSRSLIIFGQGAIRCHPYVFQEMESIRQNDLSRFDQVFWGHVSFLLANLVKSKLFSWGGARVTRAPDSTVKRYYQTLRRYSTQFAFLSDLSMITLGGALKRKEALSARLGDMVSHLYFASAVLKRFHKEGELASDKPLVDWCCQQLFYECEQAMQAIIANFPVRSLRFVLTMILLPFGFRQRQPSDKLGQALAKLLSEPSAVRRRLTRFVFSEPLDNCPLGRVEQAFQKICEAEALEKKVQQAVKARRLESMILLDQIEEALAKGILSTEEAKMLSAAELARQQAIAVDDFSDEALRRPVQPDKRRQTTKPKADVFYYDDIR